jgi:hypothetical protein
MKMKMKMKIKMKGRPFYAGALIMGEVEKEMVVRHFLGDASKSNR